MLFGAIFGLYYYLFLYNNCHVPIKYSVDNVDSRFKITKNEVAEITLMAGTNWNARTSDNLFVYDENSNLKINLVYDRRQEEVDKMNNDVKTLTNSRTTIDNFAQEYDALLTSYVQDLSAYNQEVDDWSSKGGAPPDVYARLQKEKADIESRRVILIDMARTLNLQTQTFNNNLDSLKNEVDKRKNIIVTQGLYDSTSNSITIYTFGNEDELKLVLMHELGHSLGLGHAQNMTSIMFELLDQQDLKNPTLTSEDIALLQNQCHLNYRSFPILDRLIKRFEFDTPSHHYSFSQNQ
ncbi:MAG: matrixin [Candidatus Berkelbacteria bacterium]|nr:matrixin [Candidatus Berkelbacteria bacterium]